MRPTIRTTLRAAAALALALLPAAPALAQPQAQGQLRAHNHTLVAQAAEAYGFTAARLTPAQEQAIDDAWEQLLPGENDRAYRLNRTQALAIAYVALVLRAQPGQGGWADGEGGRPGRGEWGGRSGDRAELREAMAVVYELGSSIPRDPARGGSYLTPQEVDRVRRATAEIQRRAVLGGCTGLADAASNLGQSVSGIHVVADRLVVASYIDNLKSAAQACQP